MKKIRIMMAEDHHSAREAYLSVLSEEENFDIIGGAANGYELLKLMEKSVPDIVLVDVEMPVMDGFKTITTIKEKYPKVKPIVLTMHEETYFVAQLILCGARAYLPKSCHLEELVTTINKVNSEGFYFDESLSRVIVASTFKDRRFQQNLRHLSLGLTELEVLRLLCHEKNNREVAETLSITQSAVENYRRSIYKKTKTTTLVGLILYSIKNGVIGL